MSQREPRSLEPLEASTEKLEQKYSVIAQLGHGGMSVVYLATSRGLGNVHKLVVLKSIKPELLSNDKVREMFMDEARLAIRLTHPNIVQTYEVAMIDRRPVLVMEYMEGQPLSNVLRTSGASGMPLAMKLHVLVEALNGLDHAHNLTSYDGRPLCLVHRDVSPQNIFVTYDGHVKILDFGIAKALDRSAQTEFGEIKGKIRYMAPEQMQASAELDRRADVFAMGVMLWEFLANRRMWQDAKDVEVMRAVLSHDMPFPSQYADVSPRLEAICMKAIHREPAQRYESCAAMQADLERAIVELGLRSSGRDLGRLMQELFVDTRTSIRRAIDVKLKDSSSAPIDLRVDESGLLIGGDLLAPLSSRTHVSATPSAIGLNDDVPAKKSRWPYAILLLSLLGGGAWAAVAHPSYLPAILRGPASTPANAALASGPAPAASLAAPLPSATLRVSFRSTPADAKLSLDGVELPNNPFVRELPSDGTKHELSAESPGYERKSTLVFLSGSEPVDIELVLEKIRQPAAAPQPKAKPGLTKAGRKAKPAAAAAPAGPDCSYPFYVDEAGIRRVRRECM